MTDVLPATILSPEGGERGRILEGITTWFSEGIEGAQSLLTSCIEATIEN